MQDRVLDLKRLDTQFKEFIKYRHIEKHNLETFHQERRVTDIDRKTAALDTLQLLKEEVERGEDKVVKFVACVVAPRCGFKLMMKQQT